MCCYCKWISLCLNNRLRLSSGYAGPRGEMRTFLKFYLISTGIGALIVGAAPWLVILGYFAFILPGLFLSVLPTAFLSGAAVAVVFFPLSRKVSEGVAAAVSIAGAAALMVLLPLPGNLATEARYNSEMANEILPQNKISLHGHIRLDYFTAMNA